MRFPWVSKRERAQAERDAVARYYMEMASILRRTVEGAYRALRVAGAMSEPR